MTYWTITYGGVEQVLADPVLASWGIMADFSLECVSKGRDWLRLRTTEPFDPVAPQFAYNNLLMIQRDRVLTGRQWSGGSIYFQGYVGQMTLAVEGSRQWIEYPILGPWWRLERLQFKQTRQIFNGYTVPTDPTTAPTFITAFLSETFIGEDPNELQWTGAQAITEVLNFANECWNPTKRGATSGRDNSQDVLQIGPIDCGRNFPKGRVATGTCAGAIVEVLRWFPTTVTWFDYTTTPPTLHIKDLSNLT